MPTPAPSEPQIIVRASTVVVFRQPALGAAQILMVQRAPDLSFAGAATVFPGGKVHDSDERLAATCPQFTPVEAASRIAGIREMIEETGLIIGIAEHATAAEAAAARAMLAAEEDLGVVLRELGWTLDLEKMVPFAHWLPNFKPGRIFDTRFYLANLGTGNVDLTPDLGENVRLFWATATEALAMIETGEIKAIYPTRRNLERLAQFESFVEAREHASSLPIQTVSPWIERHGERDMLRIPENLGYPITVAPLSQIKIG